MKLIRIAAILAIVMSLMNLPAGFADQDGVPESLAWIMSGVGVIGLIVAVAALRSTAWGHPGVLAIGVINLAASVWAISADVEGGAVGLVISAAIVVTSVPALVTRMSHPTATAASH